MATRPDILLVFPPFWDVGMPYLSVPTLAGYLRANDTTVDAFDLNLHCMRRVLTVERLEEAIRRATAALVELEREHASADRTRAFRENLELCSAIWEAGGPALVESLRPDAPLPRTVEEYAAFNRKLSWALRIASTPYHPMKLNAQGLVSDGELFERLSTLSQHVDREAPIPGQDLIEQFAQTLGERRVPVLGLSVSGHSQFPTSLLIAKWCKRYAPSTFVCVGGAHIPYIIDALKAFPRPFDWVDAFVSGEGERPLLALCRAVREGRSPDVPGLYVRRRGTVTHTGDPGVLDLAELPVPDFTGFEPSRYLANDKAISLAFSRGCSWSRCAFCTQFICFDGYRAMKPEQVAAHVDAVTHRFPIKTISLNDENVTPKRLREFGSIIREKAPGIRWLALARLAPQLRDPELVDELAASGCAMLSMGLESADPDVLARNHKGIPLRKVPDILGTLSAAGIWAHLFVIFGLPGETREAALRTVAFVQDNRSRFDSIAPTLFRLERHSLASRHPERYGITPAALPADHCDEEIPIEATEWVDRSEGRVFLEHLVCSLIGTPQCPIEHGNLNGQFLLQMLADEGTWPLRDEMRRRSKLTERACDMLEGDDDLFERWCATRCGRQLDRLGSGGRGILSIPSRGLFVRLNEAAQSVLRLRSLGLDLASIKDRYGHFNPDTDGGGEEFAWGVDQCLVSLLGTRILQESLPENFRDSPAAPPPEASTANGIEHDHAPAPDRAGHPVVR